MPSIVASAVGNKQASAPVSSHMKYLTLLPFCAVMEATTVGLLNCLPCGWLLDAGS